MKTSRLRAASRGPRLLRRVRRRVADGARPSVQPAACLRDGDHALLPRAWRHDRHHAPGAFNAWAIERLGIVLPQTVEYRKYPSREAMGRYTGNSNTNGFAEPSLWRIHTIWPFDNHEVVHVYTAVVGRPSDFFNEGIAVSFQTDPARGDFTVRFGYPSSSPGQQVHDACREYLRNGSLPVPVSRYVTTSGFRGISDRLLGYQTAGSFVLHMTERFGLSPVLRFFQTSNPEDTLDVIRARIQGVFGVSLDEIESSWLAMLRTG